MRLVPFALAWLLAAQAFAVPMKVLRVADLEREISAKRNGSRNLIVHVWASWCELCREQWKTLPAELSELQKMGVRVLIVSVDAAQDDAAAGMILDDAGAKAGERFRLDAPDPAPVAKLLDPNWDGSLPATFEFTSGRRTGSRIGPAAHPIHHRPPRERHGR